MAEPVTAQEVMEAVGDLRKKMESVGKDSPEFKEIQEKVEKALETSDKLSQENTVKFQVSEKEKKEMKERIDTLEKEIAKAPVTATGKSYKESAEYKNLQKFFVSGSKNMTFDETKTLRTDQDTSGGYLTSPEMDSEILKKMVEKSPILAIATVKNIGGKSLQIPVRTAIPTATFEGETEQNALSNSTYGSETITALRLTHTTRYTNDQLIDSRFDLMNEINGDAGEAFAVAIGNKAVLGTGVKEPEGYTVNPTIVAAVYTSAGSGAITADDVILLTGQLKVGYNPIFVFNRQTLATLRTLKQTAGGYIWLAGSVDRGDSGSIPNEIAGERYVVMQDMATIAGSSLSIAYGDFGKGYRVVNRTGMTIIRDDVTEARNAVINMTFHRYINGQVVLPEAIKLMKTKA